MFCYMRVARCGLLSALYWTECGTGALLRPFGEEGGACWVRRYLDSKATSDPVVCGSGVLRVVSGALEAVLVGFCAYHSVLVRSSPPFS